MDRKKIFNPHGSDRVEDRKLIGGNTTNLVNLNNVKYDWAAKLFQKMIDNFWEPNKVNMTQDKVQYPTLAPSEIRAYNGVLSFLIFLDSIQTNNLPNISGYITSPEVSQCLAVHTFQEAVHAQSYQYVIESVIPKENREDIYEFSKSDRILLERNRYIANIFQKFIDNPTKENFYRVLTANYILEGLYFYNGFNFFTNLCHRHLMVATSDMIDYIKRDEATHCVLFQRILLEIIPNWFHPEVYEMMNEAVTQERAWTDYIIGNEILGINNNTTESYTKYLANDLLMRIGLEKMYKGFDKNPYERLENFSDLSGKGNTRPNFFETTITSYNMSSTVKGWDDF